MLFELRVADAVTAIEGPLLFLRRTVNVGLNDAVEVSMEGGRQRIGRVVAIEGDQVVVELLEDTTGLGVEDVQVRFHGEPMMMALGPGLLGRVFDGLGRPRDGGARPTERRPDRGAER